MEILVKAARTIGVVVEEKPQVEQRTVEIVPQMRPADQAIVAAVVAIVAVAAVAAAVAVAVVAAAKAGGREGHHWGMPEAPQVVVDCSRRIRAVSVGGLLEDTRFPGC